MKKFKLFGLISIILILSCSHPKIAVRLLKPSTLNIGPVKKIAVMDFDLTGTWNFWQFQPKQQSQQISTKAEDLSFQDIAKKALVKHLDLDDNKTAKVIENKMIMPNPRTAYPGKEIALKLTSKLVANGHYQIIERAQLEKILLEQNFSMTGAVDETQAVEAGKLLGVDAMIFGTGNYTVTDGGDWKEYEKKVRKKIKVHGRDTTVVKKVKYRKFNARRKVTAQITYRVVDVTTGVIKASMTNSSVRIGKSEKDRKQEAYKSLPSWRPLVDQAINRIMNSTIRQIAPYYVMQRREIKKGKTQAMKSALEYAKRGMLDEARDLWQQTLEDKSKKGRKDNVAARYNLAVYHELNGDLDKAESMYDSCFKISGKTEYLDAKARIKYRRKELERLEELDQNVQ